MTNKLTIKEQCRSEFLSTALDASVYERAGGVIDRVRASRPRPPSERVIFEHIRPLINDDQSPRINEGLFADILRNKIYDITKYDRNNIKLQTGKTYWDLYTAEERIKILLDATDLFSTKEGNNNHYHNLLYYDFHNGKIRVWFKNIENKLQSILEVSKIVTKDSWPSPNLGDVTQGAKFNSAYISNFFPFFSEENLRNPVPFELFIEIVRPLLIEDDLDILDEIFSKFRTCQSALDEINSRVLAQKERRIIESNIKAQAEMAARMKTLSIDSKDVKDSSTIDFIIKWGLVFIVTMFIVKCTSDYDPNSGETKLERDTQILCDAVGGCK
jgi:hypothetical protein